MKKEAAEIITDFGKGEIYEDYSGRGMFGKTTTGITFDSQSDFLHALADVMEYEDDEERRELVAEAMREIRSDSMGLGVIYY